MGLLFVWGRIGLYCPPFRIRAVLVDLDEVVSDQDCGAARLWYGDLKVESDNDEGTNEDDDVTSVDSGLTSLP